MRIQERQKMIINVIRDKIAPDGSLLSELFVDGRYVCETLEDPATAWKVMHKSSIPEGVYKATVTQSPKFGEKLLMLFDVPGYKYIRIHAGNTAADTSGCILVGTSRDLCDSSLARITGSRKALNLLMGLVKNEKDITIIISNKEGGI